MDNIVPMVPSTPPPLDDMQDDDDEWQKDDFGSFVTPKSPFPRDDSSNWANFSSPPKSETVNEKADDEKEPEPLRFKAPSISEEDCDLTEDVVYTTAVFEAVVEENDKLSKSESSCSLDNEVKANDEKPLKDIEAIERKSESTTPSEPIEEIAEELSNDIEVTEGKLELTTPSESIETNDETSLKNTELFEKNVESGIVSEPAEAHKHTKSLEKVDDKSAQENNEKGDKSSSDIGTVTEKLSGIVQEISSSVTEEEQEDDFADFQSTNIANIELERTVSATSSTKEVIEVNETTDVHFADFQSSTAELQNTNNEVSNSSCIPVENNETEFSDFQSDTKEPTKSDSEKLEYTSKSIEDGQDVEIGDDFANFQGPVNNTINDDNSNNDGDDFADFKQCQSEEIDDFANFQSSSHDGDGDGDDWAFQTSESTSKVQIDQENEFTSFKESSEENPMDLTTEKIKSLLDICFKQEWQPTKNNEPLEILQYAKEHTTKTEEQFKSPAELRVTPLTGQSSTKSSKKEIDISFWNNLTHLEDTLALQYSWTKSGVYQFLLKAINVDTRNILTGNKNLPVYASHLGTPLEPVRQGEMKVTSPSLEIVDTSSSSTITPSENVPPAQFDWSTSGLKNPLDCK
ncbi:DgyrCDS10125 [Dimorphilus gyrociliatus]|uniref:DgyrCDS10125 n=1 Tax=Dimorphilus gyrociliatus TaxID=2664684 RepID=A0A7I8VZH3_9ANNE|nr:DgyrCDS10125 [Dimorphilus gyrociliatus]